MSTTKEKSVSTGYVYKELTLSGVNGTVKETRFIFKGDEGFQFCENDLMVVAKILSSFVKEGLVVCRKQVEQTFYRPKFLGQNASKIFVTKSLTEEEFDKLASLICFYHDLHIGEQAAKRP